jgi:CheY-like chemotaxis protein
MLVRHTITIVEDDGAFLEQLRSLLSAAGYTIRTFRGLEDAYKALCAEPPDLAIIGLQFPHHKHGIDLATALKLRPATSALPLIITSTDAVLLRVYEERFRDRAIPAIWTLPRPIDDPALRQAVARALGQPDQLEREVP